MRATHERDERVGAISRRDIEAVSKRWAVALRARLSPTCGAFRAEETCLGDAPTMQRAITATHIPVGSIHALAEFVVVVTLSNVRESIAVAHSKPVRQTNLFKPRSIQTLL